MQIVMVKQLPVAPFIVIPRDEFDEVLIESNSSLSIKDAWPTEPNNTNEITMMYNVNNKHILRS